MKDMNIHVKMYLGAVMNVTHALFRTYGLIDKCWPLAIQHAVHLNYRLVYWVTIRRMRYFVDTVQTYTTYTPFGILYKLFFHPVIVNVNLQIGHEQKFMSDIRILPLCALSLKKEPIVPLSKSCGGFRMC